MKKFLLFVFIFITAGAVLYLIPVNQGKTYIIKSNFDNALSFFIKPANWEKWHPFIQSLPAKNFNKYKFIRDTPNHSFKFTNGQDSMVVEAVNPLFYNVKQYGKSGFSSYAYEIIPSSSTNSVTIRTTEKIPLLFYFFPFLSANETDKGALALKASLENDKLFYGYNIEIEKVKDTVFAITTRTLAKTDLFKTLPKEFSKIYTYLKEKNL